jgi:hypothetical protein
MYGFMSLHDPFGKLTQIPRSKMAPPTALRHWPLFYFWKLVTPLHPPLRDLSRWLGLATFERFIDEKGRQKFLLGKVHPEHTIESIVAHLVDKGYGHNIIAWLDRGEVASLRFLENFHFQYHIRIFEDGEIRAHYERTPEAHPLMHFYEADFEERREYFMKLLEGKMIPLRR